MRLRNKSTGVVVNVREDKAAALRDFEPVEVEPAKKAPAPRRKPRADDSDDD